METNELIVALTLLWSISDVFSQRLYSVYTNRVPWSNANQLCNQYHSSTLATIENDFEAQSALDVTAPYTTTCDFWMGLTDVATEGLWVYVDGYNCGGNCISQRYWVGGEPNNAGSSGAENCGQISSIYRNLNDMVNDLGCEKDLCFLCNRPAPTPPTTGEIYYNAGDATYGRAGWTDTGNENSFGIAQTSGLCPSDSTNGNECWMLKGGGTMSMKTGLDLTMYTNISIQYSINVDSLESGDACIVQYKVGTLTNWTTLDTYNNNAEDISRTLEVPDANEDGSFQLKFIQYNGGAGSTKQDFCYISNIGVYGTRYTTQSPSKNPTHLPSTKLSFNPTDNPTLHPTPFCETLQLRVIDVNSRLNSSLYDNLYTLYPNDISFGRPVWRVSSRPNDQNIIYIAGNWIVNGVGTEALSHTSEKYYPPLNDISIVWTHSLLIGDFHIDIDCANSLLPSISNTESGTVSPTGTTYDYTDQTTTQAPLSTISSEYSITYPRLDDLSDVYDFCPENSIGFVATEYHASVSQEYCHGDNYRAELIDNFLNIINTTYQSNNVSVHSTIINVQDDDVFCSNVSFILITCYDKIWMGHVLRNISLKTITIYNNTVTLYVKNITVNRIINAADKTFVPLKLWQLILIICALVLLIFIVATLIISYYRKKRATARLSKQMLIKNPMIIVLAIGEYDDAPNLDYELEHLQVQTDIKNLCHLFGPKVLNYSIFPAYDNFDSPKMHWKQNELLNFLKEKAKQLDNSQFDALVVAVSSHGNSDGIYTSDYNLINKQAVHRMFTTNYVKTRQKPKIFIFDSCSGDKKYGGQFQKKRLSAIYSESKKFEQKDNNISDHNQSKHFKVEHVEKRHSVIWGLETKNPDFRLAQIFAANHGFESKLNVVTGSYLIHELVKRLLDDLNGKAKTTKYIHEIMDDIEKELQERGKQHIVSIYNDGTRYITFERRQQASNDIKNDNQILQIEM
eukprot:267110_1